VPELKFGKRRPDISCLQAKQTIGAAEVRHLHACDSDKRRELDASGIAWFEIPVAGVRKDSFQHIHSAEVLSINAHVAGVTYPVPPPVCQLCGARQKKEAEALKERQELNEAWARMMAATVITDRAKFYAMHRDDKRKAVLAFIEKERQEEVERQAAEQASGPAYLNERSELVVPNKCLFKYRYWQGGQSIWATLAELNAPLSVWENYAYRHDDLLNGGHARRCKGTIQDRGIYVFCTSCGYYCEKA
jgi:hypothetical protein